MSRKSQDIPIRPRYGIPELTDDDNKESSSDNTNKGRKMQKSRKTSSSSAMEASSYSEIPFLARYPHADGSNTQQQQQKAKEEHKEADERMENIEQKVHAANDDYVDDDDEDNSNSKDSSCEDNKTAKGPNSLHCDSTFPYELEGATSTDGQMRHFVADNLEQKIRNDQLSYASQTSTPSTVPAGSGMLTKRFLQTQQPQIDANVLSDIEIEAQYLAASVDNLMENLCNLLHSISSITADNVEVHKNAVNKLTDSMDANIKCMYTIMAKTEEITKSMKPTEQLGQRIREIKRLVDMLDGTM